MTYSLLYKVNLEPWNKGRIIGQKPPLKLKEIWAIRIRLQLAGEIRNLALFNLAIDSKLRACDLVRLRVCDVTQGYKVVQLAIRKLITKFGLTPNQFLFPSRLSSSPHLSTSQYAKIVKR